MRRIAVILAGLSLAGCSTMSVRVDIVDPAVVEKHVSDLMLRDALPIVRAQNAGAVDGLIDDARDKHLEFYVDLQNEYLKKGASLSGDEKKQNESMAKDLPKLFNQTIALKYEAASAALKDVNVQVQRQAETPASGERDAQIVSRLRQRDAILANLEAMVERDTNGQVSDFVRRFGPSSDLEQAREKVIASERATTRSLIGDMSLTESSEAYKVVSAADTMWHPKYDESFGRAHFGDMNLAIKMEHPGVFTIKGVTFDPSEAVRLAAKATTQALVFSAQLAGAPLKTKQFASTETTTSAAGSSGELETLQEQQAQSEAKDADRTAALFALASEILSEQNALKGTPTDRSAAIKAIKDTFDAQKPRLQ
jgi:hypothetical protein